MRIIILLILLVISQCEKSSGQGLNVELGFNNTISQSAFPICNYNGNTYFVRYEEFPDFSYAKQILSKHDTLGNLLWEREVEYDSVITSNLSFQGIQPVQTLKLIADSSGLYLFAYGNPACDVLNPVTVFVEKFSHTGSKLWTYFNIININGIDSNGFNNATGLSLNDDGNLYLLYNYTNNNQIIAIDASDGTQVDSLFVELSSASAIKKTNDSGFLVAEENQLKKIDSNGVTTQSFTFSQIVGDLVYKNEQYIALIGDSIALLNDSLTDIVYFHNPDYLEFQKIKVIENQIWLSARGNDSTYILNFNPTIGFELIQSIPRAIQLTNFSISSFEGVYDFDLYHITFVEPYQLTERQSIRYLDYSIVDSEQFSRIDSDVGVVGIEVTNANISYSTSQIDIQLSGKVCVRNYGATPVTRVRINKFHYINFFNCSFSAFSEEFINANILPGDTAWFYCSDLHRSFGFYSPSSEGNPINLNLCVYSSHPNNLVDLNVANDEGCESLVLGFHGVGSISSNNTNRKLLKITDVLGRETIKQPRQLLLYIYDNGEVEKVFQTW
jgi:hypothetical protein